MKMVGHSQPVEAAPLATQSTPLDAVDDRPGLVAEAGASARYLVPGIDTLRFFAALWVVFYHGAAPPLWELVPSQWQTTADIVARLPFNGNAAVVLFFVVSGFCIHLGNVEKSKIERGRFILQRATRIVLPLVAAMLVTQGLGAQYRAALDLILWSVYCEIYYYLVYPLAFRLFRPDRLRYTLAATLVITLALAISQPHLKFLWQFDWLTWLFCLSMWVVGCLLAEIYVRKSVALPAMNIWLLRVGFVAGAAAATIVSNVPWLRVGYIWTMPVLALLLPVLIINEIRVATAGHVSIWLERAGLATYSIYLVHKPVLTAVEELELAPLIAWPLQLLSVAVASALFYFVIERPAHRLSRAIGHWMRSPLIVRARS